MILVTGGAGFVGSNFVLRWIAEGKGSVVNVDKLTSAGNFNNLSRLEHNPAHQFVRGDIRNRALISELLKKYQPLAVINCAAETHGDRAASHPEHFIQANVVGAFDLLEETYAYWKQLDNEHQQRFRFLHLSTDEVYGIPPPDAPPITESAALNPSNLYAASKASTEHLVQTYHTNHGFPILIARSPNNFGPFQFPKKLIPYTIVNALQGNPLPVFGEGLTTHSWLFVYDYCAALRLILNRGLPGEIYNIGAQAVMTNKGIIESVCRILDELKPESPFRPHANLTKYVKDKLQESRHILDSTKLQALGWQPKETFEESLQRTIIWYLHAMPWVENVVSGEYRDWVRTEINAER